MFSLRSCDDGCMSFQVRPVMSRLSGIPGLRSSARGWARESRIEPPKHAMTRLRPPGFRGRIEPASHQLSLASAFLVHHIHPSPEAVAQIEREDAEWLTTQSLEMFVCLKTKRLGTKPLLTIAAISSQTAISRQERKSNSRSGQDARTACDRLAVASRPTRVAFLHSLNPSIFSEIQLSPKHNDGRASPAIARKNSVQCGRIEWCCERGLNSRPLPYQGSALPLSYRSICRRSAASTSSGRLLP